MGSRFAQPQGGQEGMSKPWKKVRGGQIHPPLGKDVRGILVLIVELGVDLRSGETPLVGFFWVPIKP